MMDRWWHLSCKCCLLLYCLLVVGMYLPAEGRREVDADIYCGACKAMISEIGYAISKEDPRQMINVGSFRIDPSGQQKQTKIPYAGSEVHLSELLESVCEKMTDYAESNDPKTKAKSYIRFNSRDGEDVELSNVSINVNTGKALKAACENIIEEYEDDMLGLYREKIPDVETKLCSTVTKLCKSSSVGHTEL